jgi:hypothetical protein
VDCDDQVGLVKSHDHADADIANIAGVSRLPFRIPIGSDRIRDHALCIGKGGAEASQFVLGMPREAHTQTKISAPEILPL